MDSHLVKNDQLSHHVESNIVVGSANAGDIANLFKEKEESGNTYTDSELQELLGFVKTIDNANTPYDCECRELFPRDLTDVPRAL